MFKNGKHAILSAVVVGIVAAPLMSPSNALAEEAPTVLGKTIGEWSAKWWQWALAIPASRNPMLDRTGRFCHLGQEGPVWFLAGDWNGKGKPVTRFCNIPRGKYILFSIANAIWIQFPHGDPPNNTETDYRQYANDFLPPSIGGELEATLDENPIIFNPNTPIIRSQSPVFTASFPPDNVFGAILTKNTLTGYPIVSDGFWVMLPPLRPGRHTLHFRAGRVIRSSRMSHII